MSGKLILVTGCTGFIAGEVVNQLLEAGYRVRGTTRGAKVQVLRDTIKVPNLEFAQVDDVATSDLSEALKDVWAVVHVASPLPGRTDVDDTLNSAERGTLNVLEATVKAGIEKIVITSSFGALLEPDCFQGFAGYNFTWKDWPKVTKEEVRAKKDDPFYVYFASKTFAERAVWEFAESHPQLDIATILPGFVYGAFAKHFPLPTSPEALGTNGFILHLMSGSKPPMCPPCAVDVRDVAKTHVLALNVPRAKELRQKRYMSNGGLITWREAAAHLREKRPQFKTLAPEEFDPLPGPASTWDTKHTERDLGITEWIDPREAVLTAADSLVKVQEFWASRK